MRRTLTGNGRSVVLGERTLVMGIVNVTPDSFHDGGRFTTTDRAVEHALALVEEGADLLDIGGESTRPGSDPVFLDDELARTIPVIERLAKQVDIPISIDTVKSEVAQRALLAGASWVNDISAGTMDPRILEVVADWDAPYVAMHMRGTPKTMQQDTVYKDLVSDIGSYFAERLEVFRTAGISDEQVILDPGIGFGKAPEDNYLLMANLDAFKGLGHPLLVGPSRKSFLKLVGAEATEDRLPGTLAAVTACALAGVDVVRVHDVAATLQAVRVADRIRAGRPGAA